MIYIRKSSGSKERFNLHKFRRSLFKAGATKKDVATVVKRIQQEKPKSTKRIHEIATQVLQETHPPVADRYNLKRALMELGPHGFTFEQFIAHLFAIQGYKTKNNKIVSGACVEHEVDIVAHKKDEHVIIECKFHNRTGMKSDVKVALYVQARFEDISNAQEHSKHAFDQAWLVTNTQFTAQAIKYGECKRMQLLGWGYPVNNSLAQLIEKHDLFPITTLTSLNRYQKRRLLKEGLVLCKDARDHKKTLEKVGFKPREIQRIIAEAEAVCKL